MDLFQPCCISSLVLYNFPDPTTLLAQCWADQTTLASLDTGIERFWGLFPATRKKEPSFILLEGLIALRSQLISLRKES